MDRLETHVPPPMRRKIDQFKEREGYENRSQALRVLIHRGLDAHQRTGNRADLEAHLEGRDFGQ